MPELTSYRNENIIEHINARLVPPSTDYPDSMCELLLTNSRIYALEDNYDGTYTEHFSIHLGQIDEIKEAFYENKAPSTVGTESSPFVNLSAMLSGFVVALILWAGAKPAQPKKNAYLEITYRDASGRKNLLHFKDCGRGASGFTKAVKKKQAVLN